MVATEFEFKNRFWLIGALFFLAFQLFVKDHVPISQAVADWTVGPSAPSHEAAVRAVLALGAVLTFLAAALRTWAAAYLDSDVVHDRALHSEALVADGPFRHLRNPLYLGAILIAAGLGLSASRLGFVVLVAGMTLFTLRLIGREELQLLQGRGESYREYRARVPSLIPSATPRVPAGGGEPRWAQAFIGEIFSWMFFVGMALYAATLSQRALWAPVMIGLVIAVLRPLWRR